MIFYFFILSLFFANTQQAKAQDKLTALKATETMTIDGLANEAVWAKSSWYTIDQAWLFSLPSPADFTGRYKLAWDQNYLYVLAEITDDVLSDVHPDPLTNYWDDDCLEVFLDENRSKGPHNGNYNAWAYHVSLTGDVVDDGPHLYNDHINMARTKNGTVYTWELKIKIFGDNYVYGATNTPLTLTEGKIMGFSLAYCDNDGGQSREGFIGSGVVPGADKNVGYLTADYFQELTLSSGIVPPCTAYNIGDKIEAENWCKMFGVQTETTTDAGGGSNVGWIDAGDWLSYSVNVPTAGNYNISYRVASTASTGSIMFKNGSSNLGSVNINATGGWQQWTTINQTVTLPAGTTEFTIYATTGGFNLNWLQFSSIANPVLSKINVTPASTSVVQGQSIQFSAQGLDQNNNAIAIPQGAVWSVSGGGTIDASGKFTSATAGNFTVSYTSGSIQGTASVTVTPISTCPAFNIGNKIEAENWCKMFGVQTETTSDTGGGLNVGWIDAGDWMSYSINVPVAGNYKISYRVASLNGGGNIQFKNGATIINSIAVNATGSWQTWTTISQTLSLPAGTNEFTIFASAGGFNFNWLQLESLAVIPVNGVSLSPSPLTITVGNTQQLTATVSPVDATNKTVSYSSSSPSVASVSASGLVTGVSAGTAIVTVSTQDGGFSATTSVTVNPVPVVHVTGITITPTSANLCVGQTQSLTASILPSNATDKSVIWSSSNTAIASISSSGVVTALATGVVNICVTSNDGQFTACSTITISNCGGSLKIEAETYSYKTTNPQSEACSDTNNGLDMGWIGNSDFMNYNVTVPTTGTYTLSYRVASANSTGKVILGKGGTDLTPAISVPSTGGWQNWTTISTTVNLSAGAQTFTVYAQTGGFNLNWWSISFLKSAAVEKLETTTLSSSLIIYPNPVTEGNFNIDIKGFESLERVTIQIFSLIGQLVYNSQLSVDEDGNKNVEVMPNSNLANGTYLIKVQGNKTVKQSKLIINK